MAAGEREPVRPEHQPIHQGAETVGEIRHQPVWHLAPGLPQTGPGARYLRKTLCRFTPVACQRLARLFFTATVLAGGPAGTKFPRAPAMVVRAKHQTSPSLAKLDGRQRRHQVEAGRNCPTNPDRPPAARCGRANFLSSPYPPGKPNAGRGGPRPIPATGARPGVTVAGFPSPGPAETHLR